MAPFKASAKIMLLVVVALGAGLFYILENLIGDLPSSYESHPGSAQPGLDGEAWAKVQKVIDRERSAVADKVDAVSKELAATRQRQADIDSRVSRLADESTEIKALSEDLRGKLRVLEHSRQAADEAAQVCDEKVSRCATPSDVDRLCAPAALEGASLRAMLEDEGGPLRTAVANLVHQSALGDEGCTTKAYVDAKWSELMRRASSDDVGMRDYALDDMGGSVVAAPPYTSPAYTPKGALLSTDAKKRLGLGRDVGGPGDAINKARGKGDCFAFNGQAGNLTVRLASPVVPTAVTLEHLNKVFSESAGDSAPRGFKVFGYSDAASLEAHLAEGSPGDLLLEASYDTGREDSVQVFPTPRGEAVSFVRLEVTSNHGNAEYTCLYRFRVHAD